MNRTVPAGFTPITWGRRYRSVPSHPTLSHPTASPSYFSNRKQDLKTRFEGEGIGVANSAPRFPSTAVSVIMVSRRNDGETASQGGE